MKNLYLIGMGMGNSELITPQASEKIALCQRLLSTLRGSELFPNAQNLKLEEIYAALNDESCENTGVLVTGDAGFYSIANTIVEVFSGKYNIEIINGINSLQYFAGKLKLAYHNIKVLSLHGRDSALLAKVSYNKRCFALTGGKNNVKSICRDLYDSGLSFVKVYVGENLSYKNERITVGTPKELSSMDFSELAVMIIENENAVDLYTNLRDEDFIRGTVPMTKEAVRNLVAANLSIKPTDTVYDIGAGTGSVTVVMARKACEGMVYAIEKNEEAVELIQKNREKFGVYNTKIIRGEAPKALEELPAPDAAFIGGSGKNLKSIYDCLKEKNPNVRIVVTAVTLETLEEIMSFTKDISVINVSNTKALGGYHLMTAQNPVYLAVL